MKTVIVTSFDIESVHCWRNAREVLPTMYYLSLTHLHKFVITVEKQVANNDNERPIEIIEFQRDIKQYLIDKYWRDSIRCCDFGNQSCESIATEILQKFDLDVCQVLEDGYWGSKVYKE